MIDFQGPFNEGLSAYRNVKRAKTEIEQVVGEFSNQIKGASEGAILEVRIRQADRPAVDDTGEETFLYYPALVAFGRRAKGRNPQQSLCEFRTSCHGYPVALRYADVDVRCHDRTSLERALIELLKHPDTGAKLAQLIESPQAA